MTSRPTLIALCFGQDRSRTLVSMSTDSSRMTLYDIGLDKDMLENNLQHTLNLLKICRLENGMVMKKYAR